MRFVSAARGCQCRRCGNFRPRRTNEQHRSVSPAASTITRNGTYCRVGRNVKLAQFLLYRRFRCRYARWRHAGEQYVFRALSRVVPHDRHARCTAGCASSRPIDDAEQSRGSRKTICTSSQSCTRPCSTSSNRFVSLPICTSSPSMTGRRCSRPTVCFPQGSPSGPRLLASGCTR